MLGKKVLHVLPIHVPILRLVVGSILIAVAISLGTVWGARLSAMRSEPLFLRLWQWVALPPLPYALAV